MRTKTELLNALFELDVRKDGTRIISDKKHEIYLEILIDIRDLLDDISINMTDGDISNLLHKYI